MDVDVLFCRWLIGAPMEPLTADDAPSLALVHTLHLGGLALGGVAVIMALLVYEHSLVKPNDLSRVIAAFFTMNGYVSVLFFLFWAADVLWNS